MMDKRKQLIRAIIKMLDSLVKILMRYEVSHKEFSEMAKHAFVNSAYKYYSIPGRKSTYSRVAGLTGLSRKEVVRISTLDDESLPLSGSVNRASRVVDGWIRDPCFLDENSAPKDLPLKGEGASFEELVSRYSGDITSRAILDELIRLGSITKLDKNTVRLLRAGIETSDSGSESDKINIMSKCVSDLLGTTDHNLVNTEGDVRFQRQVTYVEMPKSIVDEFKQYSNERSMELLLQYNRWLADKRKNTNNQEAEPTCRVGVGIYYFENPHDS